MFPKRLERTVIYESDWINLYTDKVEYEDGGILDKYHVLHHPFESACVVIENDKGSILLEKSKRYVMGCEEWEIPAGRIEYNESAVEAAVREVREETGCEINEVEKMCEFNPSNGMSDLKIHAFYAKIKSQSDDFDKNEVACVKWFTKDELSRLIRTNEIKCGISILALLYAMQFYSKDEYKGKQGDK